MAYIPRQGDIVRYTRRPDGHAEPGKRTWYEALIVKEITPDSMEAKFGTRTGDRRINPCFLIKTRAGVYHERNLCEYDFRLIEAAPRTPSKEEFEALYYGRFDPGPAEEVGDWNRDRAKKAVTWSEPQDPTTWGTDPDLCVDEGCPHYGTPHVCRSCPDQLDGQP